MRGFFGFQRGARRTPGRRRVLFFGSYDAAIYPRIAALLEGFATLGDDTEEHLAFAGRRGGVVVPVGAPDAWFARPRQTSSDPLKVIFFGSFTPLQGAPVIGDAIARLRKSGVEFTIVGGGQDWAECRSL